MTDESLGVDNSTSMDNSQATVNDTAQSNVNVPQTTDIDSQLMSKAEVNKLVAFQKQKAYEKGRHEVSAQYQTEQPQVKADFQQQQVATQNFEGAVNAEVTRQMGAFQKQQAAAFEKAQADQLVAQIEGQFSQKLEAAKKIDGFDSSLVGNFGSLPAVKIVAANSENADKVIAYLASNPAEAARLETTGNSFQDAQGNTDYRPLMYEFKKIADKLAMNEQNGKRYGNIPDPISQVKSDTRDGVQKNEPKTVSEWAAFHRSNR